RDAELTRRRNRFPAIGRARPTRQVDPVLFLPASRKNRHRLVKWRMHWLPSFPLKPCRCGLAPEARRNHYESYMPCARLSNKPSPNTHLLDAVLNALPRRADKLKSGVWLHTWPALLQTLREIDRLSH
ncbi:hypothetical protein BCR43DRAFT_417059, partial [Syncephalastrum racemosum]